MAKKAKVILRRPAAKLGSWAFLLGIIIAVIAGVASPEAARSPIISLLIILGLTVGLLNITRSETGSFLLASVALVLVTSFGGDLFGQVFGIGPYLEGILNSILVFVVPAAVIVAIKAIVIEEED